jgi:LPXTG-site transpeptidase (sortase) family protein
MNGGAQKNIPRHWAAAILGVASIVIVLAIIFFAKNLYAGQAMVIENEVVQNVPNAPAITAALPIRLEIPEIGVDTAIEYVDLTPQGVMGVPSGPTGVAWLDQGPRPGEIGSAVIAGHEGWKDGIAAVFDNLYKLKVGDKIYILDGQSTKVTFVVRKMQTYNQGGDVPEVFSSSDGKAHLNLITCEGTWNAAQKSYSNRLVVFTDRE